MPSSSEKQKRFMAAIAHDKEFAKKAGVPQSVGKDFNDADQKEGKDEGKDGKDKKKSRLHKLYKDHK